MADLTDQLDKRLSYLDELSAQMAKLNTDVATLIARVNDLQTQYEAHRVDDTAHNSADSTNALTTATDITQTFSP